MSVDDDEEDSENEKNSEDEDDNMNSNGDRIVLNPKLPLEWREIEEEESDIARKSFHLFSF